MGSRCARLVGLCPWLYLYSAVAGEFREGWLPDDYYGAVVVPQLKGAYGDVSDMKSLSRRLFASDAFPDVLYVANGHRYGVGMAQIGDEELAAYLADAGPTLVYKRDESSQGRGVSIVETGALEDPVRSLCDDGVVQRYIDQHPWLARFTQRSVATIRVTTVVDGEGRIDVRACYLRLGRDTERHVRSATHVRVPVHLKTGALGAVGYDTAWRSIAAHPDSGVGFAGGLVPRFDACRELVTRLHERVPFARCIGWDLCVDVDDRVQVMEWNGGHNDIKFSEATQGPCFADLGWSDLWRQAR